LLEHDKRAFWKFFSIYFGSVAFLILAAGYFYFAEQRKILIEKEHFSMIEHIRKLKMNQHSVHQDSVTHTIVYRDIKNFSIDNFIIGENYFESYIPYNWDGGYYYVKKSKDEFHEKLLNIKGKIISMQVGLLFLFALISYFLSLRALRPMQEAIVKLDNFSKDLIHDLNTPITSILLNTKILERSALSNSKALSRIRQSAEDIGELHNNLNILLQEDTLVVKKERISDIVKELVHIQEKIYPTIRIMTEESSLEAIVNRDALKQIISNIVSNACKYNKENGYIRIYTREKSLYVEDSGLGIKNPSQIFERSYKEQAHGHGIGLDIVKRLCDVMKIEIRAESKEGEGTTLILKFNI
jgi:two-component system OmpR family sensor kinase